MELYKEDIKHRKRIFEILFFPIILIMLVSIPFIESGFKGIFVFLIAGAMAAMTIHPWLTKIIGLKRIRIDSQKLYIETRLFNIRTKKETYELSQIEQPISKKKKKAESYTTLVDFRIFGVIHHPEKFKNYDLNPVTVHFDYEGKHIKIGEGLKEFNGKKIVQLIKKHRKKTKPNKLE